MSNNNALPDGLLLAINRAKSDLIDFQIATNPKYDPNWHHELIARELEHIEAFGDRDYKILIIDEPPRHGKSQQVSIDFPAWFLGRNPSENIITSSYSGDLALEFGTKTREKVNSEAYKLIFPSVSLRPDEQAKGKWRTTEGGGYTSVGVGGPLTGRGAKILVVDDPIKNRQEAESEVYRKNTWNWFTSTAFTRLEPNGVAIVMHTRWHMLDLVGMILANPELAKRTKHIHLPALAEADNLPYRKENGALWPGRFNFAALGEIRNTIGPYDWASLYQGNPIMTEIQEFKPQWIRSIPEMQVQSMNCRRFLSIDTAMSKKTYADYTGFCDNSVNSENFWHLRAWRQKVGPEELVNMLFTLHKNNNYEAIGIEKTAYTDGLKPFLDAEQRKRNTFLPLVELKHNQTAKEIRVRGLIPRYASRSVFHIDGLCKDLEEEQLQFPVGIHDDVLDAVAYQLQLADSPNLTSGATMSVSIPDL